MRKLRVALQIVFVPPAFAAATFSSLAALAGHFGRRNSDFDIFNHFAPIWLAGGLSAMLIALLASGWVRGTLLAWGAVAALASSIHLAPELLRDTGPKAPADAPNQIKIVQLNAWVRNQNQDVIWEWIDKIDPDIVVIEESTNKLRDMAAAKPGWHITCRTCEVMILSRRPPVEAGFARLLGPRPGPLTRAVFRDSRGEFVVIGIHYAWPTDSDDQYFQEKGLSDMIARGDRARTIVTGDFNSAPWSFSRRRWDAKFGLIRRERGLFTWPALRSQWFSWAKVPPLLPIDHVYAGKDWATVKVERGPNVGSDHYPVVMTLAPVARR